VARIESLWTRVTYFKDTIKLSIIMSNRKQTRAGAADTKAASG
jgi:hypothetical protein